MLDRESFYPLAAIGSEKPILFDIPEEVLIPLESSLVPIG
jgi:hypothetical protein